MTAETLGHPALVEFIREEIRARGPRTFARFMELALHHPSLGYYAAGPERLGERGDFITAGDLGPAFGRAVARQVLELDRLCGCPEPLDLIEFGAGRGVLARDLLAAIGPVAGRARYRAVDASVGMRRSIERAAPEVQVAAPGHRSSPGRGCILAVELLDALPVHRVVCRNGRLEEIGVDWDDGRFVETSLEPQDAVQVWAERYGVAAREGWEGEVCLALDDQFDRFDRALESGFALVIDYGDTADRLYAPARKRGTLLAYRSHRTSEDYLQAVGQQDLTAHVNFSALDDAAQARGWRLAGRTTQDRFLIANGILEEFDRMDEAVYRDPKAVEARWQIKRLIQPGGMGRAFHVSVYCKGVDPVPALVGLADPFAR